MNGYEEIPYGNAEADEGLRKFFLKVFGYMFLGLLTTALVAFGLLFAPFEFVQQLYSGYIIIIGLEFVFVWILSSKALTLSPMVARVLFLVYAAMNGLMVMLLTLAYGAGTIILAFFISCLFFGIMALIGAITKSDLTKAGPMLMAGLISVLVLTFINMFLQFAIFDFILCIVGLVIFLALTAYDINKLKKVYYSTVERRPELSNNIAVYGALSLYLDFINIFIRLVQILGRRK